MNARLEEHDVALGESTADAEWGAALLEEAGFVILRRWTAPNGFPMARLQQRPPPRFVKGGRA